MCTIIKKLETPIPEGIGYKVVRKVYDKYYSSYARIEFTVGKAPKLDPETIVDCGGYFRKLNHRVHFAEEHIGKFSFFKYKKDAIHESWSDQYILKCKVKNITHITEFEDCECFLAEEVVEIEDQIIF